MSHLWPLEERLELLGLKVCRPPPLQVEAYETDELNFHGGLRVSFGMQLMAATTRIEAEIASIKWPFLLLHGDADKLCDLRGSTMMYENTPSSDKKIKVGWGSPGREPRVWVGGFGADDPSQLHSTVRTSLAEPPSTQRDAVTPDHLSGFSPFRSSREAITAFTTTSPKWPSPCWRRWAAGSQSASQLWHHNSPEECRNNQDELPSSSHKTCQWGQKSALF